MPLDEMQIRRSIIKLTIGQSVTINTDVTTHAEAEKVALAFGKAKNIPLTVRSIKDGLIVTRVEPMEKISLYPEIDRLEVGEFHVFPLPPAMHMRVRQAATSRNRLGKVRLTCSRDGDQIRVTRLPMTDEETKNCPTIQTAERKTKYELERLSTELLLVFDLGPVDRQRLRQAVAVKARQTGWKIRCRAQDDGTTHVYRTDNAKPGANTITA